MFYIMFLFFGPGLIFLAFGLFHVLNFKNRSIWPKSDLHNEMQLAKIAKIECFRWLALAGWLFLAGLLALVGLVPPGGYGFFLIAAIVLFIGITIYRRVVWQKERKRW